MKKQPSDNKLYSLSLYKDKKTEAIADDVNFYIWSQEEMENMKSNYYRNMLE